LWLTILSGRRWHGELENRRKDGSLVWASVQISPITDRRGEITHFVAVQEDITERKAAEAALRKLNEELEQRVEDRTAELRRVNNALQRAAAAKDEFLASMSHELRTPLTGILGITEGLEDRIYGPLSERQVRAVKAVRSSGEHLLGLINDILDVAKAEAGLMQPHYEPFSVDDLCQASINLIRGMAQKKHLRVGYSINPSAITMEADARRVKQILVNLLSNAVKFTADEGSIGLEVFADEETRLVRFLVWDTGIGIAREDLPRLFQPFAQLHSDLAREYPGTGLGLALVRNMTEVHGGSVEVESVLGQGSRFTVVLPWKQPDREPEKPLDGFDQRDLVADGPAGETGRSLILLADDNETMLELYRNYLEAAGFRVISAQRGSEAIRLAETMQPALILMDIQMPGMDGLAAIRRLRSSQVEGVARTPIIALTALAMPGDRERCLAAGADDYLSKPIPLAHLVTVINGYLTSE
jgi:signal transduction histidine kinase